MFHAYLFSYVPLREDPAGAVPVGLFRSSHTLYDVHLLIAAKNNS